MAINISNIGESWTIKFFKETWFFKDVEEFLPVMTFLIANKGKFSLSIFGSGFCVEMVDVNLNVLAFHDLQGVDSVLGSCLGFKKSFGDRSKLVAPSDCDAEPDDEQYF